MTTLIIEHTKPMFVTALIQPSFFASLDRIMPIIPKKGAEITMTSINKTQIVIAGCVFGLPEVRRAKARIMGTIPNATDMYALALPI